MKNFRNFPDFELNFSNTTNFETKFLQRVSLWFKSFTTPHFLDWKKLQCVRFWIESFSTCRIFEKMFTSKKSPFGSFYSMKWHILHILHFSCFFKKHGFQLKNPVRIRFWIEKTQRVRLRIWKKIQGVLFCIEKKQRVRFWVEKFTKCLRF